MGIIYLFGVIIWGLIWGVVAEAVVTNRGYGDEGKMYFWLGFFFSFIPVIVAATKPEKRPSMSRYSAASASYLTGQRLESEKDIIAAGGWRCAKCGKAHFSYEYSCSCGASKFDTPKSESPMEAVPNLQSMNMEPTFSSHSSGNENTMKNNSQIETFTKFDVIKKYKELLEQNIITQEEFDAKKKALLEL